jgi:mannose-6-phosphate isomerase-like protein (cupin superfamily)
MIRKGDKLENPVTGEVLIFHRTSRETGRQAVLVETIIRPDGSVAAAHVHPHQAERFEVEAGTLTVSIKGDERAVECGEVAEVPAGVRHWFANRGTDPVRATLELRPALRMEEVFESLAGFAREGRAGSGGLPGNPLLLAVFAHEYREEIRAAHLPQPFARVLVPPLARLARMLRYRAHKPEYRCAR